MNQHLLSAQDQDQLRLNFIGRRDSKAIDIYRWLRAFGIDPLATLTGLKETARFFRQAQHFKKLNTDEPVLMRPQLHDRQSDAGSCTGHYFWQDLLVAREICKRSPVRHVDVGSRIDGFIAHLLTFRDVEVVDIRTLASQVAGLKFIQDDGMKLETFAPKSVESISSLHALEHFGLGRYGDPIVPDGHLQGMSSLARVLKPGGRMWISFPVGQPRVEFNGQRIIHPETPINQMPSLTLKKFTGIPAAGRPVEGLEPADLIGSSGWCGLYEFETL